MKFGRLTEVMEISTGKHPKWLYSCECGATHIARKTHVVAGKIQSCGCLQKESASKRATTHGESRSRAYRIWSGIRQRCTNPNVKAYSNYGGRGIELAPEWDDFECFLRDMGHPPPGKKIALDRINNEKGYCASNCRWATYSENNRNKRNSKLVSYDGKTQCLKSWAEELGINYGTLLSRVSRGGWAIDRAFAERPVVGKNQYSFSTA